MTNEERILQALRANDALDDDELSRLSAVRPRQQVNQICRRLKAAGLISRRPGASGKIANSLRAGASIKAASTATTSSGTSRSRPVDSLRSPPEKTLFLIPCSASKTQGGAALLQGPKVADQLSPALARAFTEARALIRPTANVDEGLLKPAIDRYDGHFYRVARPEIARAKALRVHILIVSGGYGLLLPEEPIGTYEAVFNSARWPNGLFARVAAEYARKHGLTHLNAFFAESTGYRKSVERVNWSAAGFEDAMLVTPRTSGGGAMIKSPRAQAQALCAALAGELSTSWTSSEGIGIEARRL